MKLLHFNKLRLSLAILNFFVFVGINSLSSQTAADFPFLATELDQENCCKNEVVLLFTTPAGDFIYIQNNAECFGGGGRLFLADGTFYCEDTGINCLDFYGLSNGTVIYECAGDQAEIDLFDRFPFLSTLVDVNNCGGEMIEFFRNELGHEFLCVNEPDGARTFYYSTGQVACVSSATFDCASAYGFDDMELIETFVCDVDDTGGDGGNFVGGVFAMTNGEGQVAGQVQGPNSVVAYGQAEDGTLTFIGSFPTGGNGGDFDGGEGLDPLISAYAIAKSLDNQFVMAVNAGSNTVTSMRVNEDFTLTVIDTEATQDIGPNSIAYVESSVTGVNGFVYVSNIAREENVALGEPGQEGSLVGYYLLDDGSLEPIANSRRELNNRPSAVQFSPEGEFLVAASINAGAAGLANGNEDEVVLYGVDPTTGLLTDGQLAGATSTLRGNAEGRNLPSAIGFQIVGDNILVVTEAREFRPDGTPPVFPGLQDGSVSTWQITNDGQLVPIALDVATGENNTGRTACWLDFSDDNTFFVSNAIEAGLASFTFNDGNVVLIDQAAAQGTGATGNTTDGAAAFATTEGWIDLWISDDGQFLYQCYGLTGEVGVYAIDGTELTLLQEIGGLPQNNVQGIVSVGQPTGGDTVDGGGDPDDMICDVDGGVLAGGPFEFCVGDETPDVIDASQLVLTNTGETVAVQFEFEVLQPADGFFVTEPWVGLHNGSFDLFNFGERATPGLESLAEGGNTELLGSEFSQPGRLQATIGNGQVQFISPGETISGSIDVRNPLAYRYASFASMIIPSNDGFFGNEDPFAYEIFDENGNYNGPIEIVLTGADLWDSGTEVNNASGAAGFSRGFDGSGSGPSTDDPTSTVSAHPGLDNIVGIQTAAGTTIGSNGGGALGADEEILRVRISVGGAINTVQAVGPAFESSTVEEVADNSSMAAVQFEFEVLQPADGFFVTEPWVGLHDGSFDLFNFGQRATPGLESLAEGGNTELLGSEFAQPGRLQATIGNGEVQFISPGETISGSIDVRNPLAYRYASFASMIIPSNDGFFGNEDPFAYEIFDENGNYNGPIEIVLTGADLWDSGTEVNNASGAAGFSRGFDGSGSGPSTDDPTSTVSAHPGLDNIVGLQTAAGTTIGSNGGGALGADEPILRVRITVGEPINTVQAVGPAFEGSEVEGAMDAVQFEFEVIQPTDGYFITEPWVGLHDGSFDLFNFGERATPGLESLAEGGNTELLGSEFAQRGRLQATIGNGQVQFISPGETISGSIDVRNPLAYRYASFASMIIPSNDGFFGNENPLEFEIFDENGNFNGPIEVVLTGADLWDAGTEVNNASGAAGFSRGFDGSGSGPSTDDPTSTVSAHPGLDNIIGIQTAAGTTIGSNGGGALGADEPILRVRISLGSSINTVQAVGPAFEGSVVQPTEGFIVTDASSGEILGLSASLSDFDFNPLSTGVSNVFFYASQGDLTGLEVGGNINNITGCFDLSNPIEVNRVNNGAACQPPANATAVGAVYAMTNGEGQIPGNVQGPNAVVAYAQAADGTLTHIGTYPTGGNGGDFDGGEGLDPLISAYAITKSNDNRFVLAVNAGSNTVTSMRVGEDFGLEVVSTQATQDIGPNSIAYTPSNIDGVNGLIYVTNIAREENLALGEPGHEGSLVGFWLLDDGTLQPIADSRRELDNRPSAVQFSPDGQFVVAASINSGAAGLANGNQDEIVSYGVNADGTLSADNLAGATSTLRGNPDNRNLPSAIGFQIVADNIVVVTEAREFQANGAPPAFPALQDGSVSTWRLGADGSFTPIALDVATGVNNTGRTACWLDFSDDNTFFVSNAIEAGLASFTFNDGNVELVNQVAAQGTGATGNTTDGASAFATTEGWIDLWISDDGQYLYQCYGLTGEVGVYGIDGTELTLIQEVGGDLPQNNVQGIVAVGPVIEADVVAAPPVGAVYAMSNGDGQVDGNVQGPNSVVAYAQAADGTLTFIGDYPTGGNGGDFDGGEGLDPLISAYAITKSNDNRFVLAVNAGSNTVTSMRVGEDFGLEVVSTQATQDIGPNSIAYTPSNIDGVNGLIYVTNIAREENLALGEPGHEGSLVGFWLLDDGTLQPIADSRRELDNRPSAVQFSPDGQFVVAASINSGAAGLANGNQDEIVSYGVNADGTLSADNLAGATSTLRGNPDNRNLPSAIGFQIVADNIVVVTEAREFQANGAPPAFPALQDGSVSTWRLGADGSFTPIALDVATGVNNTGRTACWLDFSDDNTFFVSNAIEAGLASFTFNDGNVELVNQVAAQGTGATGNTTDGASAFATTEGWIDLWISDDGQYLYQCYGLTGEVGVFEIDGTELTLIQEVGGDLPQNNVQGIVAVGPITDIDVVAAPPVGAVYAMSNGDGQIDGNVQGPNSVVAYAQAADGTLTFIGDYLTGGNGGDYDGGEGLDPLISAYAITKSLDNRFVLAVNAGSNTVTSMRVGEDFGLEVMDTESTVDIGPNSIAYTPSNIDGVNGLIYVTNIAREENLALGEPGHEGSLIGFWLLDDGTLQPIANSRRELDNRPSAVQFSPDGQFVVAASINSGAAGLANGNQDEIVSYGVNADGTLSADNLAGATSTLRGNPDNRNLPSAIGFQIVGDVVVVTEAREFQANGAPPAFPALQDGSVSTWRLGADGSFTPIALDVATGVNNTGRTACWLDFSDDNTFFVSNAIEAGLASFTFNDGNVELVDQVAAQGTGATGNTTDGASAFATTEGWIDLWISDDGQYLYQCYGLTGEVGVFEIDGTELTLIQEVGGDLPQNNVQGIVAVGPITDGEPSFIARVDDNLITPTANLTQSMISDLAVYPNPVSSNNTVNVDFNLEANAEVTLTVFSIDGSSTSLIHMNAEQRAAGIYSETLDVSSLANGFYIMQLSTPAGVMNEKLIIQN